MTNSTTLVFSTTYVLKRIVKDGKVVHISWEETVNEDTQSDCVSEFAVRWFISSKSAKMEIDTLTQPLRHEAKAWMNSGGLRSVESS